VTAYATKQDVFRYGVPRGSLASDGRLVATSVAATDTLELEGHGFATDDAVLVRAMEGGTLSAPLVAATTYYVIYVSDSTFKLSATAGGAAIDLTTTGVGMHVTIALPFTEVLEFYSRFVDAFLPAHLVPLTAPYPTTVVALVAELAGKRLQLIAGVSSTAMTEVEIAAKAQLERWAKGQAEPAIAPSMLAVTATLGDAADARGWCGSGGSGSIP
jgi:hypothetical protein